MADSTRFLKNFNFGPGIFLDNKKVNAKNPKKDGSNAVHKSLDLEIIWKEGNIKSGMIILPNIIMG